MKIKVNDQVRITKGKDRNKSGKVIQVFPLAGKVVVEGLNIMKKHMRTKKQGEKGQMIELSAPLRTANVMLLCPKCSRATRVSYKTEAGKKKRACKECKEVIE